jgi:hypothetical protein
MTSATGSSRWGSIFPNARDDQGVPCQSSVISCKGAGKERWGLSRHATGSKVSRHQTLRRSVSVEALDAVSPGTDLRT